MNKRRLKSRGFKRAENNLVNKLNDTFLRNYPHHVMPGYNLHKSLHIKELNEENVIELCQEFPYSCDLPRPLLPPARLSRIVLNKEDPALQLLTLKNQLKDDINRIMNYHDKHRKEFQETSKKKVKWIGESNSYNTKIPKYLADIAELIEMDPDPYFEGTYNWYYTGGSLNYVQLNDWDILLFPFMGDLVAANIIHKENSIWKPLLQNSAKCKLHGLLYEIRQSRINNTCRILGRYKNQCALYILTNFENQLRLNEIHYQTSKIPYISADVSLTNSNLHCTLDAKRILSLWDINKTNYISTGCVLQGNATSNAWGSIRFQEMDPNVLIYTDRCCLHYIDTRTALDCSCLTLCPKFNLENCESLSVEAPSRHYNYRYVGTNHSLLMCDNRSPEQCVQQKWTHQFKSTPLLASVINNDDKEIIVLSSQIAGENTIVLNTWLNKEDAHSYNLPYIPPCIAETLNESQMQGMCLNPYLRNRFELCNTGSTLVADLKKGGVFHFLQNSIGDVFYQCITHEESLNKYSLVNGKACYALDMWEKALSAQPEPLVPLTLTEKCNMRYIYENFTNRKLHLRLNDKNVGNFEPTWKQSLATLGLYIDLLAPELLALWNIREEASVETRSEQKVLDWLNLTSNLPHTQTQTQNESMNCVSIDTKAMINVEPELVYLDDSEIEEAFLPKVVSKPKHKKKVPRTISLN